METGATQKIGPILGADHVEPSIEHPIEHGLDCRDIALAAAKAGPSIRSDPENRSENRNGGVR